MGYPMYFRNFYFLLFIISSIVFFFSTYQPTLTLNACGSLCHDKLSLSYIQLTSMSMSAISLILFIITNYYTEKKLLEEKEKLENDRLNIEEIHAELEALK